MPEIDKRKILESIDEYNRYRAPEAIAELMKVKDNIIVVKFKGSKLHCTCSLFDWLDDLTYILSDKLKRKVELIDFTEGEDCYTAQYHVYS